MNWKTDLKLADIDAGTTFEITCRRCRLCRHETQATLMCQEFKDSYVDEVERALKCKKRLCNGPVRLAMNYGDMSEGFVGGMA